MAERPAFSRSGSTHPMGKCVERLDIPMPSALKEQLTAVAVFLGKPPGEVARDALEKWVAGELDFMRRRMNPKEPPDDGRKRG